MDLNILIKMPFMDTFQKAFFSSIGALVMQMSVCRSVGLSVGLSVSVLYHFTFGTAEVKSSQLLKSSQVNC